MLKRALRKTTPLMTERINSESKKLICAPKYYDVGVNITDSMFQGDYHGRKHHRNDIVDVLSKAFRHHVNDILLTGSSLSESKRTIDIIQDLKNDSAIKFQIPELFSTVGVHPCTVLEFEESSTADEHLKNLKNLLQNGIDLGIVKAFGEIGLDYDRLHYTPKDKQLHYFEKQLELATMFDLPLFLHMRNACDDFIHVLTPFLSEGLLQNKNLLVHSFTGNKTELDKLLNMEKEFQDYRIYISINGAGLRDESTLSILEYIPLDRLMIETDSPWCEIKKTHPSWVHLEKSPNPFYPSDYESYEEVTADAKIDEILKNTAKNKNNKNNTNLSLFEFLPIPIVKSDKFDSFKYQDLFEDSPLIKSRNEPCLIGLVAMVISKITKTDPQKIIDSCYENSKSVFG